MSTEPEHDCNCPPTLAEQYAENLRRFHERVEAGEVVLILWPQP